MQHRQISAVFDSRREAEEAVTALRRQGVADDAITILAADRGDSGSTTAGIAKDSDKDSDKDFIGKAALGAGVGTALGIAALAIPGVGPLVAAGAIASGAMGTAAVTGAAAGLAAGSLASVFSDRGIEDADGEYYAGHMNSGGVLVLVEDRDGRSDSDSIADTLYRMGGHSRTRQRGTGSY